METGILKDRTAAGNGQQNVHYFSGEQVCKEDIDRLLHAAMITPPVIRILPWKFIVIQDRNRLKILSDKIPAAHTLLKAGTGIMVCVLPEEITVSNEATAIQDCIVASENILSAADSIDLAAAWVDIYPDKTMMKDARTALAITQKVIPVTLIILGHRPTGNKSFLTSGTKDWFTKTNPVDLK